MVKVEITKGQSQGNYDVTCPRCNSSKIHVDKKGFDYNDACCGAVCLGPIGLLCGGTDSNKLMGTCMNCGKKFYVQSQLKEKWKEQQNTEKVDVWECETCGKTYKTKSACEHHEKTHKEQIEEDPLKILKNQFAEGKITEKVYLKKKKLLEE